MADWPSDNLSPELLSIIVPVYNEVRTVRQVIDRLLEVPLPIPREIIVVNDGSTDGTMQVLDGVPPVAGVLSVVHAAANRGKGSAIRIGLSHARGTIVAIQDADLELDPVQLGVLVEPILRRESDVVYGSRYLAGRPPGPRISVIANRALTMLTNVLFGGRLTDMETCYKVMHTDVARSLDLQSNRFEIEAEITVKLLKQGHRIVERPVKFDPRNRASGKKIGWRDGVHAVAVLLKYRFKENSRAGVNLMISWSPVFLAAAAAIGLAAVGIGRGTYAAGGSDSSCYALMADAFASGELQPTSALAIRAPWPDASRTFAPGGFVPSPTNAAASAPICAPGFSLLLAPFVLMGGRDALFLVTPIAGALLVWATFAAARLLGGPLAGAMAAVLIAVSPPVLYQVVQPMNDITTAALWMATYAALLSRRWALAGALCGLALLVRPNLLPLGAIAALFVIASGRRMPGRESLVAAVWFALAALPSGAAVLWLNAALYGNPLQTGYGRAGSLFSPAHVSMNLRYLGWLVDTHTPFPLLAIAAPFLVALDRRRDVLLAGALIVATCAIYLAYTPFDDWSYLRFLLPAIALMSTLASVAFVRLLAYVVPGFSRTVIVAAATLALALFCVRAAADRQAFALQSLEQRYRSAGMVVREQLPAEAVMVSVWDSGAVRFHGRKDALSWDALDPAWMDRGLAWLMQQGRTPYLLLESWEEEGFRRRFEGSSGIGKLDWPPRYEVDRKVRIYDPRDRERYHRGERLETEFLWPLRE